MKEQTEQQELLSVLVPSNRLKSSMESLWHL